MKTDSGQNRPVTKGTLTVTLCPPLLHSCTFLQMPWAIMGTAAPSVKTMDK